MNIYRTFGVPHGASIHDLRKARRVWMHQNQAHNDQGSNGEKLTKVNALMQRLKDPTYKQAYDQQWAPVAKVSQPRKVSIQAARAQVISGNITFLAKYIQAGHANVTQIVRSIGQDNNLTFAWTLASLTHSRDEVTLVRFLQLVLSRHRSHKINTLQDFQSLLETLCRPAVGSWDRINHPALKQSIKATMRGRGR